MTKKVNNECLSVIEDINLHDSSNFLSLIVRTLTNFK